MKILVVDDEPVILNGIINIIKKEQSPLTNIQGAYDGFDALEKAEDFNPDLIITDINMPEMSGFELIKQIVQKDICKRFIIISGYNDFEYARKALRYNVLDYILKPINKFEVLQTIERVHLKLLNNDDIKLDFVEKNKEENLQSKYSKRMKDIIDYIEEYYKDYISLEVVSECVNLHPNYISALFKREIGKTFLQYVHSFRIEKAKELILKNYTLSINEIALEVGYENPENFFKVFRKHVGQTPSQYRKMIMSN